MAYIALGGAAVIRRSGIATTAPVAEATSGSPTHTAALVLWHKPDLSGAPDPRPLAEGNAQKKKNHSKQNQQKIKTNFKNTEQ